LNCLNPDGYIAKLNTSRSLAKIDGEYLSSLSDDAAPQLLSALPNLPEKAKASVISTLKVRSHELQTDDWRSWDVGADRAKEALREAGL